MVSKITVTSVKIDEELWKEAKIEAIRRRITVAGLLNEALRREIERCKKPEKMKDSGEHSTELLSQSIVECNNRFNESKTTDEKPIILEEEKLKQSPASGLNLYEYGHLEAGKVGHSSIYEIFSIPPISKRLHDT